MNGKHFNQQVLILRRIINFILTSQLSRSDKSIVINALFNYYGYDISNAVLSELNLKT